MIEYYKSDVAVMVKVDDPTNTKIMPSAVLPEYEEWKLYSGVSEVKDGVPVGVSVKTITRPVGSRPKATLSYAYDIESGKVDGELLATVPTVCLIRVESEEPIILDKAEKLDAAKMETLVSEIPAFNAVFTDLPTEK